MAAELTPDPDSPDAWRRRVAWLERLYAAGEFDQVRRLGEKWALDVPASLRGRLTALRAHVQADQESGCGLLAEAFQDLAGRDPARAAQAGSEMSVILGIVLGRLDEGASRAAAAVAQARAAGNPVILRDALAADGFLAAMAGEADAGDRLRAAAGLPGFDRHAIPYDAPEMTLALWYLWRGEPDPARDLLNAVIASPSGMARTQAATRPGLIWWRRNGGRATGTRPPRTPPHCPLEPRDRPPQQEAYLPTPSPSSRRAAATSDTPASLRLPELEQAEAEQDSDVRGPVPVGARPARAVGR